MVTIEKIYISWPSANGGLAVINFGASTIWPWLEFPPPVTITGPGWLGNRTIAGGTQKTLEFRFESNAVKGDGLYKINVTFDNGCKVSFNYP